MQSIKTLTIDQAHRFFGIEFNQNIFAIVKKEVLSNTEKESIIQMAHASLLHWQKFSGSKIVNVQRGQYMIAKAYIVAGEKENASKYANLCFKTTSENKSEMQHFDIGYAYEMKARAAAINGNKSDFEKYHELAVNQMKNITNKGDLKYFKSDFESGNWFGYK